MLAIFMRFPGVFCGVAPGPKATSAGAIAMLDGRVAEEGRAG
ncbi:hypothetical protein [Falsiroseomonas sp. E2-1-a4]